MSASPIEIVGEWLQNLLDPEVVHKVVAHDATYASLNTEDSELKRIIQSGRVPRHGTDAFIWNLSEMFRYWQNENFEVTSMFGEGEDVAVFGYLHLPLQHPGKGCDVTVLDPCQGGRRQGHLPAVPRGQLRHRRQFPQRGLLDRARRPNRCAERSLTPATCDTP